MLLAGSQRVAIIPHIRPDADALGSALALWHALLSQHKAAAVLSGGSIPDTLRFLPGFHQLITTASSDARDLLRACDLIVVCDTQEASLLGDWWPLIEGRMETTPVIVIDHHRGTPAWGTAWIDQNASSTAEMVTTLLRTMDWPVSAATAQCLAAGIIGDTSHFTNSNSTAEALEATAYLVRQGADLNAISSYLDSAGRVAKVQLWGEALQGIHSEYAGRYVSAAITQRMLHRYGVEEHEIEGLSNFLRTIEGVAIAAVFFEQAPARIRVSLRAVAGYDVQAIARRYPTGGGHQVAAGCTLDMNLDDAQREIAQQVYAALAARESP